MAALQDIDRREWCFLAVLALAVLWMGLYPKPVTDILNVSVSDLLQHVANSKAGLAAR